MLICTGAAASAQPTGRFSGSLLWKISGNGLEKPSYLFGTHHLYSLSFFDEIPGARAALQSADQVVGELLMSDQAGMAAQLQVAAMMPEGTSYQDLLSPSDYERLDNGLRGLTGVGLSEQFKIFRPAMISMLISQLIFARANPGFDPAEHVAVDAYVQNYAAQNGKPVVGLETIDDQISALFDSEPMKLQAEQLVCSIGNIDYAVEQMEQLGKDYAHGDLDAMYVNGFKNPDDPCPSSDIYQDALARDRNDRWLTKLPSVMSDGSSFIAVGALHLAGEEGLLYRLDQMGYKVEKVKSEE